jgi:hypothetical protein
MSKDFRVAARISFFEARVSFELPVAPWAAKPANPWTRLHAIMGAVLRF